MNEYMVIIVGDADRWWSTMSVAGSAGAAS